MGVVIEVDLVAGEDMVVEGALVVCAMTGRKDTVSVVNHAALVTRMVAEELVVVVVTVEVVVMGAMVVVVVVEEEDITGMMAMVMEATIVHEVCATSFSKAIAVTEIRVNSLMRVVVELWVGEEEEDRGGGMVWEEVGYATNGKLETAVMVIPADFPTVKKPSKAKPNNMLLKYSACCSKIKYTCLNYISATVSRELDFFGSIYDLDYTVTEF